LFSDTSVGLSWTYGGKVAMEPNRTVAKKILEIFWNKWIK
jgi:hypothetical protein